MTIRLRFFPRHADDRDDGTGARYLDHLRAVFGTDGDIWRLATTIGLHDGLITRIAVTRSDLRLRVTVGDNRAGYRNVELAYGGLSDVSYDYCHLNQLVDGREFEILDDEFDTGRDGRLIHRIAFSRQQAIEIECNTFEIVQVRERQRRGFPRVGRAE